MREDVHLLFLHCPFLSVDWRYFLNPFTICGYTCDGKFSIGKSKNFGLNDWMGSMFRSFSIVAVLWFLMDGKEQSYFPE